jgi:hypothetical protein
MYALIIIAAAGYAAWRLEFWPFDRSYKYLPKHGTKTPSKAVPVTGPKPGP